MQYDPLVEHLPSSAQLPDSDETPVDNELQDSVPTLLKIILAALWKHREDWFFGIDMAVYYAPDEPPIVPDGFLCVGVSRFKGENGRPSYVLWEEGEVVPILVLEVVSRTYRGEYNRKLRDYAELGVRYYAIYNPNLRRKREPLEIYELNQGTFTRLTGEPVWLEGIGLSLGRGRGRFNGWEREWLYWFGEDGQRFPSPEERAERLAAYLRNQGVDPDKI
ncbi:Uma2 family endonuclease [Gloeobacter violaceus]|uniref:Glr3930 protein n=1 Tax=Gloeobacter violaceus (strain ATCC 29082 / PCC 7421) TaxID=251221 RepID=Q7NEF0_GLOVI|nr:Uma2 family endonuclease [Gloeobacter violaceus]BAC91871.1 glr3930 [Gloeobacter violaceus PCC 7421]